jgi:signal-transduction protein with cAMP-binding, CBS, and nucleotidyltransferase domain
MKTGYKVYDCMTTKPISVTSDSSLEQCAKVMAKNHVGALVIKKDNKSIGLITEQDIVRRVLARGINPVGKKVRDFMEKKLKTISSNSDIYSALIIMRDSNIRHLPVIDKGKMVGLLTLKDILRIEPSLFDLLVEKFELREAKRKPIERVIQREAICQGCGAYVEDVKKVNGMLLCERCAKEQA